MLALTVSVNVQLPTYHGWTSNHSGATNLERLALPSVSAATWGRCPRQGTPVVHPRQPHSPAPLASTTPLEDERQASSRECCTRKRESDGTRSLTTTRGSKPLSRPTRARQAGDHRTEQTSQRTQPAFPATACGSRRRCWNAVRGVKSAQVATGRSRGAWLFDCSGSKVID